MLQAALIIAAQLAGIAAAIYHPYVWVRLDAAAILANGSADSLLLVFHRQRATWRAAIIVAVAVLVSLPASKPFPADLWQHYWLTQPYFLLVAFVAKLGGWLLIGQLIFSTLVFFAIFNPALNVARNLPYVGKWFVSWNPKASRLDRSIWQWAWRKVYGNTEYGTGPDEAVGKAAGEKLEAYTYYAYLVAGASYLITAVVYAVKF